MTIATITLGAFWGNLAGLAALLGIGLVIALLATSALITRRLTRPPRRTYASAVARGLPGDPRELDRPLEFETWALRSGSHALPAWTIRGENPGGPTLIFAHGWGDSRVGALARVPHVARLCAQMIALDLPGQGDAAGLCALGTREHAHLRAAMRAVEPGRGVILFGWSLGAGACLRLAGELGEQPDAELPRLLGVIAEAPYRVPTTPARNVLELSGLPHRVPLPIAFAALNLCSRGELSRARFDRVLWASRARVPVLVLHGRLDEICPLADGEAIAAAAPRGRVAVIDEGHHNDLWTEPALCAQAASATGGFVREIAGA